MKNGKEKVNLILIIFFHLTQYIIITTCNQWEVHEAIFASFFMLIFMITHVTLTVHLKSD